MTEKFSYPDFSIGNIELRHENGEICIYANNEGLKKIQDFCESLKKNKSTDHVHLDDFEVLTKESLKCVIVKIT